MMNLKNLKKGLLVTTTAGIMAFAPIAVHAADTEVLPEKEITVNPDGNGKDLLTLIKHLGTKDGEEYEADVNLLLEMLESPQNRVDLIKAALDDQNNLEMTEEEKIEVAESLGTLTTEDVENAINDFIEFVESDDFDEALAGVVEVVMEETAQDIDEKLNELGQYLIDITPEDILAEMNNLFA